MLRRLTGEVQDAEYVDSNEELATLRRRVEELEAENLKYRREREDNERKFRTLAMAVGNLRKMLEPDYRAMRALFGELDLVTEPVGEQVTGGGGAVGDARWEAIKRHNPGRIAEAIDILLAHGTMNNSQLATALKMNRNSCATNIVPKLRKLGLIVGGREFSLKAL